MKKYLIGALAVAMLAGASILMAETGVIIHYKNGPDTFISAEDLDYVEFVGEEDENNPGGGPGTDTPDVPNPDSPVLVFGYCGDLLDGLGVGQSGVNLEAAIEIPAEQAQQWEGNYLTGMRIGLGKSSTRDVMVYLTESLTGEAFYSENVTLSKQSSWNEVTFAVPYKVTGKKFYLGYHIKTRTSSDYPLGIDGLVTNNKYADNVGLNNSWEHMGSDFGSVCIQAIVAGDNNLPKNSVNITNMFIPPFVGQDQPFSLEMGINNNGSDPVSSVGVSVKVDDTEIANTVITLENPVEIGEFANIKVEDVKCTISGASLKTTVEIVSVNGEPNVTTQNGSITSYLNCSDKSFARNVLVEEFTGTWCGFCPRGMVGMKYMEENYGEEGFIGIAVHASSTTADPMQSSSYVKVVNTFTNQFPSAVIDRNYLFDPDKETLEQYFLYESRYPAFSGIDVTVEYDPETKIATATAEAEFAMDIESANYTIAIALAENNVGPYVQANYFAGGQYGVLEGWSDAASSVMTYFNEVGRVIVDPFGVSGSLPKDLVKGENYTYTQEFSLANYKPEDCYIVAMILAPKPQYEVLNAAKASVISTRGVSPIGKREFRAPNTTSDSKAFFGLNASKKSAINSEKVTSSGFSICPVQ